MSSSADIILNIINNNERIRSVRFFPFSTSTKLQDRLTNFSESELNLIEKAKARKAKDGSRFWDGMLSVFSDEGMVEERLLCEALYHQANTKYEYVQRGEIDQFFRTRRETPMAINSKVIMEDGSSRHFALLDFKLPASRKHDLLAAACARALGLRGYVLDSGRSYHFIGKELIAESELLDLLAKFALLAPLSDKAWASHQLIERSASLRITAKAGREPSLVAEC